MDFEVEKSDLTFNRASLLVETSEFISCIFVLQAPDSASSLNSFC